MKINNPSCIALIPARSGSKRIPKKNIRILDHHPLIAYTIQSAIEANFFSYIIVSTDDIEITKIAKYYGAEVPFLRPEKYATLLSPDIEWVKYTLKKLKNKGFYSDCFAILRPTSPFRTADTIKRAWNEFIKDKEADSIRGVEKCTQHPAKMWQIYGNHMIPLLKNPDKKSTSWHSIPYQALPEIFSQNASLEIAWSYLPLKENSISGKNIIPFITTGFEGYDINDEKDWIYAEYLIQQKKAILPTITKRPYQD